jgi:hypothetical protein
MIWEAVELAGLAVVAAGIYLVAGLGPALIAGGGYFVVAAVMAQRNEPPSKGEDEDASRAR